MRDLEKMFSYSLSEEIMPYVKEAKTSSSRNSFALIFNKGDTISAPDIIEIANRTSLSPLLFDVFGSCEKETLRSYSRSVGAPIIKTDSRLDLTIRLAECAFSVSEGVDGALISIASRTPSYINAGDAECRRILGEVGKMNIHSGILIPYTKNRTAKIRRPHISDSDFIDALFEFYTQISSMRF